jgi:hypothetical protein
MKQLCSDGSRFGARGQVGVLTPMAEALKTKRSAARIGSSPRGAVIRVGRLATLRQKGVGIASGPLVSQHMLGY